MGNTLLQMITSGDQPFLFEEIISPQIQEVGAAIVTANPAIDITGTILQNKGRRAYLSIVCGITEKRGYYAAKV